MVGVMKKHKTPEEIDQNDMQKKLDKDWLDNFLNGVETTKQVLEELNDQAIADILSEEVMAPKVDTEIDLVFIDDDDVFSKDELTDQDKELIKTLLDKSNYDFFSNEDIPDIRPPVETGD